MHLAAIYRHPVKSLGCEPLERIGLEEGEAVPGDRAYAIAHGRSVFDPDDPQWQSCGNFLRVANIPTLARPAVAYDRRTAVLTVVDGGVRETFPLATAEGREALATWAGRVAGTIMPGPYRVAQAPGVAMTDSPSQTVSLMSLASLRDLSSRVGATLDPRRFRGNLWIEGKDLKPWAEAGWSGHALDIGGARVAIVEPINRCLATAADPQTGARRDNPLPALKAMRDEPLFGMLARVVRGGSVATGDAVRFG